MTRFSTVNLPRPVVIQELDYEAARAARIAEYVERLHSAGIDYEVGQSDAHDPVTIAAGAAATGDMHFVARLNDAARSILLPSFAEGSDLVLQAQRAGIEPLEGETDAALRERIRLAWKGKSAAGPDDYYKSAARNHSVLVKDVALTVETRNFSDRVLILSVLTTDNNGLLSDTLRDSLTVALNNPAFRSRNVTVEIVPAVISTKNVSAMVYLYPETPDAVIGQAQAALVAAMASDQRLGFDLTRSYVEKHLHLAGVQRVELQGWTNGYADFNEAVRLGTVTLTPVRLSE